MPVLVCEHDEETDLAECTIVGGVHGDVRWWCAAGYEHEAAVSEL